MNDDFKNHRCTHTHTYTHTHIHACTCLHIFMHKYIDTWASQLVLALKNLPANVGDIRDTVLSLCQYDPLEKEMTTHSSVLAWRIPWTEEPGGLQSIGSHRAGHDWRSLAHMRTDTHFYQCSSTRSYLYIVITFTVRAVKSSTFLQLRNLKVLLPPCLNSNEQVISSM